MSNNLSQKYIELINRAARTSNESEKRNLIDQANRICSLPAFTESGNSRSQGMNYSNDSSPGNSNVAPIGSFFSAGSGISYAGGRAFAY
jgi:hypothetical protein